MQKKMVELSTIFELVVFSLDKLTSYGFAHSPQSI